MPQHWGRGISKQASDPCLDGQEETRSSSCPGKNGRDRQGQAATVPRPETPTKYIHTSIIANKGFGEYPAPQVRRQSSQGLVSGFNLWKGRAGFGEKGEGQTWMHGA